MAKARTEPKPATPAHEADRISVDAAFQLMRPRFEPHAASARLNQAIIANEIRLRCTEKVGDKVIDNVIDPNIYETHLRVAARQEPDGRWVGRIEPTKALVPSERLWTMSRAEVESLLQESRTKRGSGGSPGKYDHARILIEAFVIVDAEGGLPRDQHGKQTLAELCRRVVDAAPPDLAVPDDTSSTLKDMLSEFYHRFKSL
jgi:hypothetical protein